MVLTRRAHSSVALLAAALGLATAAVYMITVAGEGIDADDRAAIAVYGVGAIGCAAVAVVGSALESPAARRWLIGLSAIGFLGLGMYAFGTLGMPILVAGLAAAAASVHTDDPYSGLS